MSPKHQGMCGEQTGVRALKSRCCFPLNTLNWSRCHLLAYNTLSWAFILLDIYVKGLTSVWVGIINSKTWTLKTNERHLEQWHETSAKKLTAQNFIPCAKMLKIRTVWWLLCVISPLKRLRWEHCCMLKDRQSGLHHQWEGSVGYLLKSQINRQNKNRYKKIKVVNVV